MVLSALRAGDNDAWRQLMERYSSRLIGLARSKLGGKLEQKVGASDVVQSVYRTVYRRLAAGQFQFGGWDSLLGMLIVLTARRCYRVWQHYQRQARDPSREVPLGAGGEDSDAGGGPGPELRDRQPTPEEAAMLAEMVLETLGRLGERERQAVLRGLLGDSDEEIGRDLGLTEYTVRLIRQQYGERLRDLDERDPDATA